MTSTGSVTYWISRVKSGDAAAVQKLWEAYFQRLVLLARSRLQSAPRRMADEEDVALSAFHSFCCGAEEGRFPQLTDRDDLWQLLVLLTARKASNLARQERRQKRGGGKVQHLSALEGGNPSGSHDVLAGLVARDPDPEFAAQVAEECQRLLARLEDPTLQTIAMWKMEGHTNEAIAARLGRSLGTVERKLRLIRKVWEEEAPL